MILLPWSYNISGWITRHILHRKKLISILALEDCLMYRDVIILVITGLCWAFLKCSCGACITRLLHWWRCYCWSCVFIWEHGCWKSIRSNTKQWVDRKWKSSVGNQGMLHLLLALESRKTRIPCLFENALFSVNICLAIIDHAMGVYYQ